MGQARWVTELSSVEKRTPQSGFLKSQACVLHITHFSRSLHCCPLVAKPASCSRSPILEWHPREFVPILLVTSFPRASHIPHEMLPKVLSPGDSLVGSTWGAAHWTDNCVVSSCCSSAVHFLGFSYLSSSECHIKVDYKNLNKLRPLSCCSYFMCPRQICI